MYGIAFGFGPLGVFKLVLTMVCVDFALVGCIVATITWYVHVAVILDAQCRIVILHLTIGMSQVDVQPLSSHTRRALC